MHLEVTLVQMDGKDDRAHLLVEYLPKLPLSSLVNSVKGVSSRLLRQRRSDKGIRRLQRDRAAKPSRYPLSGMDDNAGALRSLV